jgi:hypothetical protein
MRLLARLAVVAFAAFLIWEILGPRPVFRNAAAQPAAEPARIELVRIELPEAQPKPPPPPEPGPPALPARQEAESAARSPTQETIERGEARLQQGAFPRLRATYARIGFRAYRDAVLDLGAGFFLFDSSTRQPLATVNPKTGELSDAVMLERLSRWPRDVTRHLPIALERGRARYGARASRVILLPPASVDAALLGALEDELLARGIAPGKLLRVDVAYELVAERLHCRVLSVALSDGSEQPLALRIDLSGGTRT